MNIKNIKVTSLVFFGLLLLGYAVFSMAEENSGSSMNIALDSDQDGLSDVEEKTYGTDPMKADTDGDGYIDGAEVQSGYDPSKPAPGDKIVDEDKTAVNSAATSTITDNATEKSTEANETVNLTEEISNQVATLFSEKSAGNKEITMDDLDAMVQNTTEGTATLESLPEIDDKDFIIKKLKCKSLTEEECTAKEKEDAIEYLTAVSYIIFNNSPKEVKTDVDVNNLLNEVAMNFTLFTSGTNGNDYFNDFSKRAEKTMEELKKIEVPEKMTELHKKGLKLAKYGIGLNDKTDLNKKDPINNIVSLTKLRDFIGLIMDFSQSTTAELEKYGIGIDNLPIKL
jgi:hypothetical protein